VEGRNLKKKNICIYIYISHIPDQKNNKIIENCTVWGRAAPNAEAGALLEEKKKKLPKPIPSGEEN
jgi:hypothetical protein